VGLAMDEFGILYGHLVYYKAMRYSLWQFGIFSYYLVHFFHFGMLHQRNLATMQTRSFVSVSCCPFQFQSNEFLHNASSLNRPCDVFVANFT
jgi:hypothetical protein